MADPLPDLPEFYQTYRIIAAAPITAVSIDPPVITVDNGGVETPIDVPPSYFDKGVPAVGDYFTVIPDPNGGYKIGTRLVWVSISWEVKAAFEQAYTVVIAGPPGPPGPAGPPGPTAVSADAENLASLGTDGLLYVPDVRIGVTDGSDAAPGEVGEYLSLMVDMAAAVAAASGAIVDIGSLSLPAGDWDVQGQIWIASSGTREALAAPTSITGIAAWVSMDPTAMPTIPAGSLQSLIGMSVALSSTYLPVLTSGRVRFSLAVAAPIYLGGMVTFTSGGPLGLYGFIGARRVR